ncbi:MAG: molybdenum cofactor biosynthesis protein MoaA, partial [Hadesarchaea archaeon]
DERYAKDLSEFKNLHVRVSLKGTNPQEFSRLTGAKPEAFELALKALKNLLDQGVSCHPAVMLSFSPREALVNLKRRLEELDPSLPRNLEEEYVFLYPHVEERLKRAGIRPLLSYHPGQIPKRLR